MEHKTHWKKMTNPDFLGAYSVDPGEDLVLTIKSAGKEVFTGQAGKKDEGIVIHFMEAEAKPMICNATNAKSITKVAGSPYVEDWRGTRIALYVSEVSAFGETVDALRVRNYAPKEELFCEVCGAVIKASNGKSPKMIAANTKAKYGKQMCADCATEAFKKAKEEEADGTDK